MTLAEAKALEVGQIIYDSFSRNADGTPTRWKVNGRVKTWVTMPELVRVPLKHGLYTYDYLDESVLARLHLTEEDAL